MNYKEIDIRVEPLRPFREIITALLAEEGYESFVESEEGLQAYIPSQDFDEEALKERLESIEGYEYQLKVKEIEHSNWNAQWEADYRPVQIAENCVIRALFHEARPELEFDLIIQPQMSFGTGHHPTTLLMAQQLLNFDLKGKSLIDLGTGTGVLAILAEKKGATDILATDIEDHIVQNAKDNVRHNDCVNIRVDKAELSQTSGGKYPFILANINLNALVKGLAAISELATEGALVMMSGFYTSDVERLIQIAKEHKLQFMEQKTQDRWAVVQFKYSSQH